MIDALVRLRLPQGGTRLVLRDDEARLWLADQDETGFMPVPLFRPAAVERLVMFAEHAAVGTPQALQSPNAIPMLATLCLALVAVIDSDTNRRLFK